jgi:hypothetical protein
MVVMVFNWSSLDGMNGVSSSIIMPRIGGWAQTERSQNLLPHWREKVAREAGRMRVFAVVLVLRGERSGAALTRHASHATFSAI